MLVLQAVEVRGPSRWRWLLTDGDTGNPLADHEVALDVGAAELRAFGDVYGYARAYAAPDRRAEDEVRLVAGLGAWAGRVLLGERVGAAIVSAAPITVRVTAEFAIGWPLELAHAGGVPLAARGDVSFVYAPAGTAGPTKAGVGDALRVLAVFSQPTRTSVLALRRERYELGRLIRRLVATRERMVELTVVQYGVTRERLAEIVDTGAGWDVLHLSGHGGPGAFVLEHANGSPDPVEVADLVGMLRPARRRVKLAVVSACESAAAVTAQTLRLIGLTGQAEQIEQAEVAERGEALAGEGSAGEGSAGVAAALVAALDCAVVAMRYPVDDEFAIGFGGQLYEHVLGRGQPVDVAVARAETRIRGGAGHAGRVRCAGGGSAIACPRGDAGSGPGPVAGRVPAAGAGAVRGPGGGDGAGQCGAGAGQRPDRGAAARHGRGGEDRVCDRAGVPASGQFRGDRVLAGTDPEDEWEGALAGLAAALETQLGRYGFAMTGHIGTVQDLTGFLPRLRQLWTEQGVLLVLDNLEPLLTAEGTWRDPRWDPLIAALTGHDGESRVIMTSRVVPAGTSGQTLVLPVHALSLGESVALARELPNLRGLLHAGDVPVRASAGSAAAVDRDRVRRVLRVVQGHPKLMELADAAAADRARLDAQLAAAEDAASGQGLEAFFRDGDSAMDPGQFVDALSGWTVSALDVLTSAARLMAQFIACLEDDDRRSDVIDANWADLWERLDRPGDPPPPGPLLDALTRAALAQPQDGTPVTYRVHPGVAAAITAASGPDVRDAADTRLAAYWTAVSRQAREGREDSGVVVTAGLAAAPYLLRQADWDTAAALLDHAIRRDRSPGVVAAALPALRRIAEATGTPVHRVVLARALRYAGQAEAGPLLRDTLAVAVEAGDYRLASAIAGGLADLLREAGRLGEALAVTGQMAGYSERAGLGPWTQLLDQAQRLQILADMGEHERVLAQASVLRDQMGQLPARPGTGETVQPWQVREFILDTGYHSALALGRWQQCLDLTGEITASQRDRGAGLHDLTWARFNDAEPLIGLGRLAEAGRAAARVPAGVRGPPRHPRPRHGPEHPRQPGGRVRPGGGRGGPGTDRDPVPVRPPRTPRHRDQPPQPR